MSLFYFMRHLEPEPQTYVGDMFAAKLSSTPNGFYGNRKGGLHERFLCVGKMKKKKAEKIRLIYWSNLIKKTHM